MKILSIPLLHHDTSISILENRKITCYNKEERFSRILKNSMIEYLYFPEIEILVDVKNKKLMYQ